MARFWTSFASLLLLDLAVVSLVLLVPLTATRLAARRTRLEDANSPKSTRFAPWRMNPLATAVAEGVLAELYARGDITEGVYRERMAVPRSTDEQPPDSVTR